MPRPRSTARQAALEAGSKRYQGAPCHRAHNGERFTRNGLCCECQAAGQKARRAPMADDLEDLLR